MRFLAGRCHQAGPSGVKPGLASLRPSCESLPGPVLVSPVTSQQWQA